VEIRARRSGQREVTFSVSDQGPGIAADQAQAIFTPFHSSRPEGLGMGLAISRSLMEAMGGSLDLTDGSGGATFTGTLLAEASPIHRIKPPRSQP
jgi:two-component system, LuxR family, sensor kinase FixL